MASLVGRFIRSILVCTALFALVSPSPSEAAPYAAIVMDARTGEELWSQNADARLHPASLTKMMTLYITFQELQSGRMTLDTEVVVSKNAAAQPPSRLGLKPGQRIKVRYLIRAAAIKSANDAASALGDHIGGSEAAFAERMTRTARALGMRNTTFKNANGLTAAGHLSSARDMNLLGRHLFYDFPQFYNIFSRRTADAGMAKVTNTNSRFLDGYEGADGIKTGYTVAAGFNLTASARRGDKRLIATVFGGTSTAQRNGKMVEVMNKGFGLARERVREKPPAAAPIPEKSAPIPRSDIEALVAEAAATEIPAAAKTIRVSGEVTSSPRPRSRPAAAPAEAVMLAEAVPVVPDALSAAIAEGVESALAEAVAEPPPANSFEAQALALSAPPAAPRDEPAAPEAAPEAVTEAMLAEAPPADSLEAQAQALAGASGDSAPPPAPGSLEAQALALASGESTGAEARPSADASLATLRPRARPDLPAIAETPAPVQEEVQLAAVDPEPVLEMVAAASAEPVAPAGLALAPVPAAAETLTAAASEAPVERVAAATIAPELAEPVAPTRKAPIFDSVELASASEPAGEELVVVSKSTAGGRAWGVSVGAYSSHYEAERALLKTGLAESATLDQGLRKVTQSKGKYRASFLGLTEEQAGLACRRLRARGMACEANGPA